jgi:hypothetical protein
MRTSVREARWVASVMAIFGGTIRYAIHGRALGCHDRSGGTVKVYQRDKHAAEMKGAFEKWSAHVESLVTEKEAIAA